MNSLVEYWGHQADILRCKSRLLIMGAELRHNGYGFRDYLVMHEMNSFAIYGAGDMGEWFLEQVRYEGLSPMYLIDRNENICYDDVNTIALNEEREKVDVIVVTVTHKFLEISNQVGRFESERIVSLEDILEELYFRLLITPFPMRYYKEVSSESDSSAVCISDRVTAVCFFAYNRPEIVRITLNAIAACDEIDETPLIIVQDNSAPHRFDINVKRTHDLIVEFINHNSSLNIEYIFWKRNAGPFISLTQGMSYALDKYDRVIRIEDDIEVRPDFLVKMKAALSHYEDDERVFGVSGYNPSFNCGKDTFMAERECLWGGGIYRKRFREISWNKDRDLLNGIDVMKYKKTHPHVADVFDANMNNYLWDEASEDLLISYHIVKHNLYTVFFDQSLCRNRGFDSGVHGLKGYKKNTDCNYYVKKDCLCFTDYKLSEKEMNQFSNSMTVF